MHSRDKFPKDGTWDEQKAWVDNLPESETYNDLDMAIEIVEQSPGLFNVDSSEIPGSVEVEVFHHAVSATPNDDNSDSDSENDDDSTAVHEAVVTRKLNISNRDRKEELTLRIPGEQADTLYKIKFGADGRMKSVREEKKPLSTYTTGLTTFAPAAAATPPSDGVVVRAKFAVNDSDETRYKQFTKK